MLTLAGREVSRLLSLSLLRRCLRAARKCPTFNDRELMRVYSLNRFRDAIHERDPARVRRLMADGAEEVERMESLQRAIAERASGAAAEKASAHHVPAEAPATFCSPDVQSWGVEAVGDWLGRVGLGSQRPAFEARGVRGRLLLELDDEDLQELGVGSRLERKRILAEVRALLPSFGAVAPSVAAQLELGPPPPEAGLLGA